MCEVLSSQFVCCGVEKDSQCGCALSPAPPILPLPSCPSQYDEYKTPMDNIGMQDSLLSRFDLIFIVLDEVNHVTSSCNPIG